MYSSQSQNRFQIKQTCILENETIHTTTAKSQTYGFPNSKLGGGNVGHPLSLWVRDVVTNVCRKIKTQACDGF